MKKLFIVLGLSISALALKAQTLVHYWNFNVSTSEAALLTPTSALVSGASITHIPGGSSAIQITSNTTGQGFEVTNPNARNSDPAGAHLRFNNPIGGTLIFALPTTGYEDPIIKYAARRSGSGAGEQIIEYTVDGTNYLPFTTVLPVDGNPELVTLDFSAIAACDNNADFKIKITFAAGSGGTGGNNRFDNLTLDADVIGANDVQPPVVTLSPANGSVNVAVNSLPSISFNEAVRLINNDAIDNTNVDALVELRLNNAAGAAIPFDATISGNTITLTPASNLLYNQVYYLALLPNVVEDLSDNAVATVQTSSFTTITEQTQFQPGDLVFVAYRMNASGADDAIAFMTFTDILPGTLINFTDAKYTSNAQAQCAGGFTWTAPLNECITAGSVITITTSPLSASKGTLTGADFGLSSGGDQVMVYTGTAANPTHITALSSNGWIASGTACGGSLSMIPASLADGISALNMSSAPGNVSGNTANAYYNGIQTGSVSQLRTAILDPQNWISAPSGSAPQTWPNLAFPGPPAVLDVLVQNQTTLSLVFNTDLQPASATNTANFTGIAGLNTVTQTNNGTAPDTLTLTYATPFTQGSQFTLTVENLVNSDGITMSCPFTYTFEYNTHFSLVSEYITVKEDTGSVIIRIAVENPSPATVDLVLKPFPFSNTDAGDLSYTTQTISIDGSSSAEVEVTIQITDDATAEQDEYFVLALENAQNSRVEDFKFITVYIRDNDRLAPQATKEVELLHVASYDPVAGNSTCEIVTHDPVSQRIFMTSSIQNRFDIADFSNPAAIVYIDSVDMSPYGEITSIAVYNGIVAVASPNADPALDGSVVFFDVDGNFISQVSVGNLPDMVTFTPDGQKVLTANEGQPNDAYTIDPEGSVSVIDISGGVASLTQANVNTLYFTAYNSQEAALISSGVRKLKSSSTLSQDFEPEFISIAPQSDKAWVTLQENNAIAVIDLNADSITGVFALGTKDYNAFGNGFDASDNSGTVHLSNWPVKAFYIPDAIANFSVGGTRYLVSANEGDEKELSGLNERTTVGAANLDTTAFPHAAMLKKSFNLGRMRMTNLFGDTDTDGDFDEIYVVGSRSFTIWDAATMLPVYDSGDDFELITSRDTVYGGLFNADNENNGFKSRSRAKGPEPEGITLAKLGNSTFAFVGLERIGGVMVYNVSNPANVEFVDYINTRSLSGLGGDLGPEGLVYISPENSPDGKHYILVSNEISGTVAVFEIQHVAPEYSLGADTAFCTGASVTLTAPGGYAYLWSTGETTQSIQVASSAQITVDVIAVNGNTATDTLNVTVNPLPVVNFNGLNYQYYVNDQAVVLTGFPAGGTFSGTGIFGGVNFGPFVAGVGGPYPVTYTYTNPNTGCTNSETSTVTVLAEPVDYTGMTDATALENISVYPNPSADRVQVVLDLVQTEVVEMQLLDMQGKTVQRISPQSLMAGKHTYSIDREALNLKTGTYSLIIRSGNKETVLKIVFL